MKIAVGADERLPIVETILNTLEAQGITTTYLGAEEDETKPWASVAKSVAESVASGKADQGILLCWTGTGMAMAANKVPGVRAALCVDAATAVGARIWNDANVLCLSMRLTSEPLADEIVTMWLEGNEEEISDETTVSLDILKKLEENKN